MEKSENDDKYIQVLKTNYENMKKAKQGDTKVIYKNQCDHEHREPSQIERDNLKVFIVNGFLSMKLSYIKIY